MSEDNGWRPIEGKDAFITQMAQTLDVSVDAARASLIRLRERGLVEPFPEPVA